ncbi:MAG: hypothetical protein ACR2PX_14275 [Endozoicomonas sp.]|uniref:hypothetical protein n=1 Tax=Endozoicomonas sp. TaxID=1892382 RepID=UPI003D9AD0B5
MNKPKFYNYPSVIHYYQRIREDVWSITEESWPNATVKGISLRTAEIADSWKTLQGEGYRRSRGIWDWKKSFTGYQKKPKRFEMSIWAGDELCGLTYGSVSRNGSKICMNLIEATPVKPSPLGEGVFPILSFGATAYADLLGADEIWLLDPVLGAIDYYKSQGYMAPEQYGNKRIGMKKR